MYRELTQVPGPDGHNQPRLLGLMSTEGLVGYTVHVFSLLFLCQFVLLIGYWHC